MQHIFFMPYHQFSCWLGSDMIVICLSGHGPIRSPCQRIRCFWFHILLALCLFLYFRHSAAAFKWVVRDLLHRWRYLAQNGGF